MNTDVKKIIKITAVSIFSIFIIAYAFFVSKDLIFGVKIKDVIMSVNDVPVQMGTKVSNNIVKITGNAKNAVNLNLNDRIISIDQKGNFNETIVLLLGYNIITIKANDEFGNSDEKDYKLMF